MKKWTCDDCGSSEALSATTTVRQDQDGNWIITGDINIDWCDTCQTDKPRATLKESK